MTSAVLRAVLRSAASTCVVENDFAQGAASHLTRALLTVDFPLDIFDAIFSTSLQYRLAVGTIALLSVRRA